MGIAHRSPVEELQARADRPAHEALDQIKSDRARRGSVTAGDETRAASAASAAIRVTDDMAPGELFMAFHFPQVAANLLTSDGTDEVTACPEYKVTAVRMGRARDR